MKGNQWTPKVFSNNAYSVKVGDPDLDKWKIFTNLKPQSEKSYQVELGYHFDWVLKIQNTPN